MTKKDIELLLKCCEDKSTEFEYKEYMNNELLTSNFIFEILMRNELGYHSLVKYTVADSGYHHWESARESFVLSFLGNYLTKFTYAR